MSTTEFRSESGAPDFIIRSIPDNQEFKVSRAALEHSQVFSDMFSCCNVTSSDGKEDLLDLDEPASTLIVLLRLLHLPPYEPTCLSNEKPPQYDPTTIIPLPLIPLMFMLIDKYALEGNPSYKDRLGTHLAAHAPTNALKVYGLATRLELPTVAADASQYVGTMSSYSAQEVAEIPTVDAYHALVKLQAYRVLRLKSLLQGEEIFPHGYGTCQLHPEETKELWDLARRDLLWKIESLTDLAGEMEDVIDLVKSCETCHKAATAAVDMLRYKCKRIPRKMTKIPGET